MSITMELLRTIVMLCQIGGTGADELAKYVVRDQAHAQLTCQKYYVKCLKAKNHRRNGNNDYSLLTECITERKIK